MILLFLLPISNVCIDIAPAASPIDFQLLSLLVNISAMRSGSVASSIAVVVMVATVVVVAVAVVVETVTVTMKVAAAAAAVLALVATGAAAVL